MEAMSGSVLYVRKFASLSASKRQSAFQVLTNLYNFIVTQYQCKLTNAAMA